MKRAEGGGKPGKQEGEGAEIEDGRGSKSRRRSRSGRGGGLPVWPGVRMSEEQIAEALGGLSDESPAWLAVCAIVDAEIEEAASQVSHVELAERPGLLQHTAGGLEWLRTVRERLREAKAGVRAGVKRGRGGEESAEGDEG